MAQLSLEQAHWVGGTRYNERTMRHFSEQLVLERISASGRWTGWTCFSVASALRMIRCAVCNATLVTQRVSLPRLLCQQTYTTCPAKGRRADCSRAGKGRSLFARPATSVLHENERLPLTWLLTTGACGVHTAIDARIERTPSSSTIRR